MRFSSTYTPLLSSLLLAACVQAQTAEQAQGNQFGRIIIDNSVNCQLGNGKKCGIAEQALDLRETVLLELGLATGRRLTCGVEKSLPSAVPEQAKAKAFECKVKGTGKHVGQAYFTDYNGYLFGTLADERDGFIYSYSPDESGNPTVSTRHSSEFKQELDAPIVERPEDAFGQGAVRMLRSATTSKDGVDGKEAGRELQGSVNVDIMMIWTKKAECLASNLNSECTTTSQTKTNILGKLNQAINDANLGLLNSGITDFQYRLVYAYYDPLYVEPSTCSATLNQLSTDGDSYLDEIHGGAGLRNVVGADMVVLVGALGDCCGMGYVPSPNPFASAMFNIIDVGCNGIFVLAHESGHNLGCQHDRSNGGGASCTDTASYNFGYRNPEREFRTVMAYDCTYSGDCPGFTTTSGPCVRLNQFSDPNAMYNNMPLGDITGLVPTNNKLIVQNSGPLASSFLPEKARCTQDTDCVAAGGCDATCDVTNGGFCIERNICASPTLPPGETPSPAPLALATPVCSSCYVSEGNMFDVKSLSLSSEIRITGIRFTPNQLSGTVKIYTKVGSFVGFEYSAADWTLALETSYTDGGDAFLMLPQPIIISAGGIQALYVTAVTGEKVMYTGNPIDGTVRGDTWAANTDLEITWGSFNGYPFGGFNHPRGWNGAFQYELSSNGGVPPVAPTRAPTRAPTKAPTKTPAPPTKAPTKAPTKVPTKAPTLPPLPTKAPTTAPTKKPTKAPTKAPTKSPTRAPTVPPTQCSKAENGQKCVNDVDCCSGQCSSGNPKNRVCF